MAASLLLLKAATAQAPEQLNEDFVLQENPEVTQQLYDQWLKQQSRRSNQPRQWYCSCVLFAKEKTGVEQSIGAARNWPKNTPTPAVGGVVVTNESASGHVAYITAVRSGQFDVIEANYVHCQVTVRTLNINDPQIRGYWKKVIK